MSRPALLPMILYRVLEIKVYKLSSAILLIKWPPPEAYHVDQAYEVL
jgi:hypothetical protein